MGFLENIKSFLKTPIIVFNSAKDKWTFIAFIAIFVVAFLLIFQPFGVNNFDPSNTIDSTFFFSMLGFGLVVAVTLALFEFVIAPLVFKQNLLSTFLLKLIIELVVLAAAVFLYYNIMGGFHDWSLKSYLGFVFNISMMSIIPIIILVLFFNYKATKNAFQKLEIQPKTKLTKTYVLLKSSNKKDSISLTLDDLLFIEAQDNYVEVCYWEHDRIKRSLLRTTMKDIEDSVNLDVVMRCHRSFIVNMNKVEKVIREGHQLQLFFHEISHPIIVSRTYVPKILAFLDTHHK